MQFSVLLKDCFANITSQCCFFIGVRNSEKVTIYKLKMEIVTVIVVYFFGKKLLYFRLSLSLKKVVLSILP